MEKSRLITSILFFLFGIFMFFQTKQFLSFLIPAIIGLIIIIFNQETKIEERKDLNKLKVKK